MAAAGTELNAVLSFPLFVSQAVGFAAAFPDDDDEELFLFSEE